jgi:hypothetical protein
MKPEQLDEIERLAKAALSRGQEDCESLDEWLSKNEFVSNMLLHPVDAEFASACTPNAVLSIIAEIKRLRTELNDFTTAAGDLNAEVVRLREREEKYQQVCAAAYQLAGTMDAPVRFLDALSDASCGEFETRGKIEDLLPVTPDETGSFLSDQGEEFREDAERWRWLCEKNADVDSPWCVENGYTWVEHLQLEVDDARNQENPNANDKEGS